MDLQSNTIPSIRFPSEESTEGGLGQEILREAVAKFQTSGALLLYDVFPVDFVDNLHAVYKSRYSAYFNDSEHADALKVGNKRFMVTVEVEGPFNSPNLYANPGALGIIKQLLGTNCVLSSFGSVVSLPGSAVQHVHRDHPGLYRDEQLDGDLPSFAITMLVPLVEMNESSGTTRTFMGSHRADFDKSAYQDPLVPVGSCLLMDYRLLHGGLANRSSKERPILYNVYCRPWFRDDLNFRRQSAIKISDEEFGRVPEALQNLFSWRGDTYGGS